MDITRNHYFLIGMVLLFVGVELRMLDSVTLTPEFTKLLTSSTSHPMASMNSDSPAMYQTSEPAILAKTIDFPDWAGWGLVSFACVLILHSWAMKKPGT